jgi:hypothetical protein
MSELLSNVTNILIFFAFSFTFILKINPFLLDLYMKLCISCLIKFNTNESLSSFFVILVLLSKILFLMSFFFPYSK